MTTEQNIEYRINSPVTVDQFVGVLTRSTLAERRPVTDRDCLAGMLDNSNLVVSAWRGDELVGIARSMTDFHYACYLSDLAVDQSLQGTGIGRKLLDLTRARLGPRCKLILIAAPAADSWYEKLGFTRNLRCWHIEPGTALCS